MEHKLTHKQLHMNLAIKLAAKRRGLTYPNPTVGCVIVHDDIIIAQANHEKAGEPHAERRAIFEYEKKHGRLPEDCVVYVTLEPCSHQGKTPPCADLLIERKVETVYIGMKDPNPLVAGQGIEKLEAAGINTEVGILENECRSLNRPFIKNMEKRQTYFSVKCATTLDGMMADQSGKSKWITGDEARTKGHELRAHTDGILTTINTIEADDPSFDIRLPNSERKNRVVILDKNLDFEASSKVVNVNGGKNIYIVCLAGNPQVGKLKAAEINVIELKSENAFYSTELAKQLYQVGFCHLLVEGGANLTSSFLDNKLADELHLFIAPILLGSQQAHSHYTRRISCESLDSPLKLEPIAYERLGKDSYQRFLIISE